MGRKRTYEQEAYEEYQRRWQRLMALPLRRSFTVRAGTLAALGGASAINALLAACAQVAGEKADSALETRSLKDYQYSPFPLVERYHWRRQHFQEPPYIGGNMYHSSTSPANWNHVKGVGAGNSGWGGVAFQTLLALHVTSDPDAVRTGDNANMDEITLLKAMLDDFSPAPDFMSWTGKLTRGIYFHEFKAGEHKVYPDPVKGRECTADDVVFSLDVMKRESPFAGWWEFVDRFETLDRYTFKVHMNAPVPFLPQTVAAPLFWIFRPEDYPGNGGNQELFEWRPIGTGAYKIIESKFRIGTWPKAHERFHWRDYKGRRRPYADFFQSFNYGDNNGIKAALRTGNIDMWSGAGKEDLDDLLATTPNLQVQVSAYDPAYNYGIVLNHNYVPFKDVRVRRALSMAINRKEVVELTRGGAGTPPAFVPFNFRGRDDPEDWDELSHYFRYRPDEAKQLLAEAGYAEGLEVEVMYDASTQFYDDIAAVVRDQWQRIGVKLVQKPVETTVARAAAVQGTFPQAILDFYPLYRTAFDLDGFVFNYVMPGRGQNVGHIEDPVLAGLAERQRYELDPDRRSKLAQEIHDRFHDQVHHLLLYSRMRIWIRQPWLYNTLDHLYGIMYGWYSQQVRGMNIGDKAPPERAGHLWTPADENRWPI